MSVAEQIAEAVQHRLKREQALAKELVQVDEEVAKAAVDTFNSLNAAGSWLIRANLSLGGDGETPMELSRTLDGKVDVLRVLGRIRYGVFS